MSARHLIRVEPDDLEAVAHRYGLDIERSADEERVYVVWEGVEFWAPSLNEVPC